MHEVRDAKLRLLVTDRKGPKYEADVTARLPHPVELPGNEVQITIETIEEVE
jgi:hypothetical protein